MTDQTPKTDRERALERITKCMRLSKSSEPHESAAALRQAQKLMQQYSIEESEIHGFEVKSVLVYTPEPPKTRFPAYLVSLVGLVCRAFDAQALFEVAYTAQGAPRQCVRYFVAGGRAPLVQYAHEVIWRQLTEAWKKYRADRAGWDSQAGERSSFWLGWIAAVSSKVMDFGSPPEEREIVAKTMHGFDPAALPAPVQDIKLQSAATRAGYSAAGDFSIHTPMEGEKQRLLN